MSQSLRTPYPQTQVTHEIHERKHSVAVPALIVGALTAALVAGLLRDRPREEAPAQAAQAAHASPDPTEFEGPRALAGATPVSPDRVAEVRLSSELLRGCEIGTPDAWFSADSAALQQSDESSLDELASCLLGGPLAGRQVRVWGHADVIQGDPPRGLGLQRAEAVASFLRERGVQDLLVTPSRQRWAPGAVPEGIGSHRIIVIELVPQPGAQP